jgi:HAD superfamily hydrolase (TIGR01509 family)
MLKSVIFDLDGVVADSHPLHMRAWRRFLLNRGLTVTDEKLAFVRDGRRKEEILRYFLGELSDDQVQAYGREKDRLFREEVQSLRTIEGVGELLDELHRAAIPMAIASSGSLWRVHHTLNLLGLGNYFATVVTGDEVRVGKPHPAIFHKAARQMRVRPEESLVLEDSVSGVRAATAGGLKCLGIADPCRAPGLLEAGAKQVFPNCSDTSLSQLRKLFA